MNGYDDGFSPCCGPQNRPGIRRMTCTSSSGTIPPQPWAGWGNTSSCPGETQPCSAWPPSGGSVCPSAARGPLEQEYPPAMAYVPWQQWQNTYAPERGLVQGTIFPELDLKFSYGRCRK